MYLDLVMVGDAPELEAVLQGQELPHRQSQAAKVLRLYGPDLSQPNSKSDIEL